MHKGFSVGVIAGSAATFVVISIEGGTHRPPILTGILFVVVYLALAEFAGHMIEQAVS